jgi:aryl-alcohol dehydrogenase-like predicted oxidoreductase
MNLREFPKTSLRVSELCLGTMTMGWQNDERESHRILDRALDGGINFFDTADVYSSWVPGNPGGVAEQYLGRWLKNKRRNDLVIATKCRGRMWEGPDGEGLSRTHILRACDDSLRRLGIEQIDLYQCHAPDPNTPIEETVEVLGELVKAGKVRYLGVSNFPGWLTMKANLYAAAHGLPQFVCTQPKYNLTYRRLFDRDLLGYAVEAGLAVIPYSPLEGGLLTGKYKPGQPLPESARHTINQSAPEKFTAQVVRILATLEDVARKRGETMTQTALVWLLSKPFITAPIIGATSVAQLEESLGAGGKRLTPEEMQTLDDVSASASW